MARPRKTIEQKKSQGTLEKSRELQEYAKLRQFEGHPGPPAELNSDGKKYWNLVWSHLVDIGHNRQAFYLSVYRACNWFQLFMEALRDIQRDGWYERAKSGWKQFSPNANMLEKAEKQLCAFETKYGLDLVSSQRIAPGQQIDDPDGLIK